MIVEVRSLRDFSLLYTQEVKDKRVYDRTCKKLTSYINRHNRDFIVRRKENSYVIKIKGRRGLIIGIKQDKNIWI